MRVALKVLAAVGSVLLAVGAVLFFSAFAFAGFDTSKLYGLKYGYEVYEQSGEIETVEIDYEYANIKIIPIEEDKINVVYPVLTDKDGNRENDYTVTETEKKLTLTESRSWFKYGTRFLFRTNDPPELTVKIPRSAKLNFLIKTVNGKIEFAPGGEDLYTGNKIELSTVNGNVEISRVEASYLSARSTNGTVSAEAVKAEGEASLATVNGKITADTVNAENFSAHTTNGNISVIRLIGELIRINSTNGDVTAVFVGNADDYVVTAETVNGDVNGAEGKNGAEKSIYVKTVNGDINISFTE